VIYRRDALRFDGKSGFWCIEAMGLKSGSIAAIKQATRPLQGLTERLRQIVVRDGVELHYALREDG
jgi:hypothetical protein